MHRKLMALAGLAILALLAVSPRPAAAQQTAERWETFAGGDEVLALEANPVRPSELWAGTEGGGVVVWDLASAAAKRFTQYLFPAKEGLGSNNVYDIAFRPNTGDAWLATETGVTHAAGAKWQAYGPADGLPPPPILAIAVQSDGTVWAGAREGLAWLNPRGGGWQMADPDEFKKGDTNFKAGPGALRVVDLAVDKSDHVYVAHGPRPTGADAKDQPALSIYDGQNRWRHVESVDVQGDATQGPRTDQILALSVDLDRDVLWMGSQGRGVLSWDLRSDKWQEWKDGTCKSSVWRILAEQGQVWAACFGSGGGQGVGHFDGTTWRAYSEVAQPRGLPTDVVTALAQTNGTVYLGTNGTGSSALQYGGYGIVPVNDGKVEDALSTFPYTPSSNDITAVLPLPDGKVWAGTRGFGLMYFDGTRWTVYTTDNTGGQLLGNSITDLAVRDNRELWVASAASVVKDSRYVDGGVSSFDLQTERWDPPLPIASNCSGVPDLDVSSLAVGDDGRLWIGLGGALDGPAEQLIYKGNGIAVYSPATNQWECHTVDNSNGKLNSDTILDLALKGNEAWAATSYTDLNGDKHGGGASHEQNGAWLSWGGGDDGFRSFHGQPGGNRNPYVTGDVRSIAIDPAGRALAGTYAYEKDDISTKWPLVDAVINRYDSQLQLWEAHTFGGSGWVSAVALDSLGQVWAGTSRGHRRQEFSPTGSTEQWDTAYGGVYVWNYGDWTDDANWARLTPPVSGIASKAITALRLEPSSGAMWVGTENSGLSVYRSNSVPIPTATPCSNNCTPTAVPPATSTPNPGATPLPTQDPGTGPILVPITPAANGTPGSGGQGGDENGGADGGPQPPPEVPEPATLVLFGAGLAGLWAYARRRRGGGGSQ